MGNIIGFVGYFWILIDVTHHDVIGILFSIQLLAKLIRKVLFTTILKFSPSTLATKNCPKWDWMK